MKKFLLFMGILSTLLITSCAKKPVTNGAEGKLEISLENETISKILSANSDFGNKEEFIVECIISGDYSQTIEKTIKLKDFKKVDFFFEGIPENANITVTLKVKSGNSELYSGTVENIVMNEDLPPVPVEIPLWDSPDAPAERKIDSIVITEDSEFYIEPEEAEQDLQEEESDNEELEDNDNKKDDKKSSKKSSRNKKSSSKSSGNSSAKDTENQEVEIPKEPLPAPEPVTNLTASFDINSNKIILNWTDPETEGYSHVEITNSGNTTVATVEKGKNKYVYTPGNPGDYSFTVTTFNQEGLKGKTSVKTKTNTELFKSFTAPVVANTGAGQVVQATVKGVRFTRPEITPKSFGVSCKKASAVGRNFSATIVDDETVILNITIPSNAGTFPVVVNCGDVTFVGEFEVKDYSHMPIGHVVQSEGKPVAVIAGYDSLGYPFGVGLKEKDSLKWATESTFGYNNCFYEIVSEPSQIGVNSAVDSVFSKDIDGADNWDLILSKDPKCFLEDGTLDSAYVKKTYPAFDFALNYGTFAKVPEEYKDGWFVPSLSELCQIFKNRAKLEEVFATIGARAFENDFYWSSSQNDYYPYNACAVRFTNGSIYKYYIKSNAIIVRCVRMFK